MNILQKMQVKKCKKTIEKDAIRCSKCARAFEQAGNHQLASLWWLKYRIDYKYVKEANTMLHK